MLPHNQHKRAIEEGLRLCLPPPQVEPALALWERDFAASPAISLQRFVDSVMERLHPECARRELYRALVRQLYLPSSNDSETADEDKTPIAVRAFCLLLQEWLERLSGHHLEHAVATRHALMHALPNLRLPRSLQDALLGWLDHRQARLNITQEVQINMLRSVLHEAYIQACHWHGPVIADRTLGQAVREVEQRSEFLDFKVRSLL